MYPGVKPQLRCLSLLLSKDVTFYRNVQLTEPEVGGPVDPSQEDLVVERHVSEYSSAEILRKVSHFLYPVACQGVYRSVPGASAAGDR